MFTVNWSCVSTHTCPHMLSLGCSCLLRTLLHAFLGTRHCQSILRRRRSDNASKMLIKIRHSCIFQHDNFYLCTGVEMRQMRLLLMHSIYCDGQVLSQVCPEPDIYEEQKRNFFWKTTLSLLHVRTATTSM